MPNPTTTNLGLNKIDRTSPETTYFDLNKYIDQNAEKVDSFAGEVREEISTLQDRLDHAETKEITLNPGIQVVNSPKDSRFKLSEIQGRTLINLLGSAGDCETTTGLITSSAEATLDSTNYTYGTASLLMTSKSTAAFGLYSELKGIVRLNKYYLALSSMKIGTSLGADLRLTKSDYTVVKSTGIKTAPGFGTFILLLSPMDINNAGEAPRLYSRFEGGEVGLTGNIDGMRLYEVTEEEYNALSAMTPEQIVAKYPFVQTGIVGVENPYVIGYGDNLIPPLYDYESLSDATWTVNDPYSAKFSSQTTGGNYVRFKINVAPNTDYTLSCEHNGYMCVTSGNGTNQIVNWTNAQTATFNPGQNEVIYVFFGSWNGSSGTVGEFSFSNPMLVLGTETKPFKPQRKSILALQTTLHANPSDGSEPDVLFEKEGQYFRLAKWKKIILDGSHNWVFTQNNTGFKVVKIANLGECKSYNTFAGTRHDGKPLIPSVGITAADYSYFSTASGYKDFFLAVSNDNSGWGDSYTPTAVEIKAYFMGWKMSVSGGTRWDNYNGTGSKVWIRITRLNDTIGLTNNIDYTSTLPTTNAGTDALGNTYKPYQLLYRLAKEVVEPVQFEGALLLPEGESMFEVGTGIVLRDIVNPVVWSSNNLAYINSGNEDGTVTLWSKSRLSNKTEKLIDIYKNGLKDTTNWDVLTTNAAVEAYGYGVQYARSKAGMYDPYASYTATYTKLDKFPILPIKGVVADNEKAQISDLVDAATYALSVVSEASTAATSSSAIKTVIPYVTTKNGDTFIIPTNDRLSANQQITVKFNADSTGTPSLQFGSTAAYPIKKANGSAAKFYASVYTLFFDGSAFILSGEGGEVESYGTATASDVIATKTILTESGLVAGTMSNRGTVNQTITTQNGQYTIPQGYHSGSGKVTATFANLVAGNVKSGVSIGGVVGTLSPSVSGSSVVNFDAESPFPANTVKLYPLLTLPAGIKFATFLTSSNTIFRDTDTAYGYIRFRDTVTGQVFDNRMLNQFTVTIIRITFDFATEYPNTRVLIETNSQTQSPYNKANIIGLKTTNPIELIGYVENKNSYNYNGDLFRIHGTFNYA